jgi:hypothetical protein
LPKSEASWADATSASTSFRMHRHRLAVEPEHAAVARAALHEPEHLLEQAMVAEARIDQALFHVADGRAGRSTSHVRTLTTSPSGVVPTHTSSRPPSSISRRRSGK